MRASELLKVRGEGLSSGKVGEVEVRNVGTLMSVMLPEFDQGDREAIICVGGEW